MTGGVKVSMERLQGTSDNVPLFLTTLDYDSLDGRGPSHERGGVLYDMIPAMILVQPGSSV